MISEFRPDIRRFFEKFDELNLLYFESLWRQKQSGVPAGKIHLYDGQAPEPAFGETVPTAVAPDSWMKHLPVTSYDEIFRRRDEYVTIAKKASLWIKKTQGGGGTAIERRAYLARKLGLDSGQVHLGSKGTDLFTTIPDLGSSGSGSGASSASAEITLAEIQIMQSLLDLRAGQFAEIFYQDLVSAETALAVENIWKKACPLLKKGTYEEASSSQRHFHHSGVTYQQAIPTVDEKGELTLARLAPGGHAFFALDNLWAALKEKIPDHEGSLVSVIGNGEDLGSTPDAAVIGWAIAKKAAIVMITTEKTEIDMKGGQIALSKNPDTLLPTVHLIEQAQAKEAGQLKLFEDLGLTVKKSERTALFNTNVALFNFDVLIPKLKKLQAIARQGEMLRWMTPVLIENKKKQKDDDGVTRTYEQLEGAMGSTLLNLDAVWRERFGEPLVHFVNIKRAHRTRFFSPVKTAFDFFMLFHSDRFSLDPKTLRLKDHRQGWLPSVTLDFKDQPLFYSEVENVLRIFKGAKILNLDTLQITGPVNFQNKTLDGKINFVNASKLERTFES